MAPKPQIGCDPNRDVDVTVVMSPRERFSGTRRCIESLYEDQSVPFELICIDGGSPPSVSRHLAAESRRRGFRIIRRDHYLTPNEARNLAIPEVRTKYIAFVDNDVEFTPGWLAALRRCAEETGADIVTPVICIGKPLHSLIHFAGGEAHVLVESGQRFFHESHHCYNMQHSDVRDGLVRQPTECAEFHCVLVRSKVFERIGLLDENLKSIYEHSDLCMTVRASGGTVMFEPEALVTYVFETRLGVADLPFFFYRWNDDWALASEIYFHRKWSTVFNDDVTRGFVAGHRRKVWSQLRKVMQKVVGWRRSMFLYDAGANALIHLAERRRRGRLARS
jgi:glycosyltransferase involved in cell wall biosynthesis